MTTASTGLLCWRDFHPLEWQLASLHQIRSRWPKVKICLRADSGFAREELMAWCEENGVEYVFGLAKNERLVAKIARELEAAEKAAATTGAPARRFKDFMWRTLDSWSCQRRVI